MGIQERKQREKEQRRRSILDMARELIRQKSYLEITMEDIARELELSRATLYLYFRNKSEIYLTLLTEGMWQLRQDYDRWQEQHPEASLNERLMTLARVFFIFYQSDYGYFDLMFSKREEMIADSSPEAVLEHKKSGQAILEPLFVAIQEGIAAGTFRKDYSAEKIAWLLRAVIIGIAMGFKEGKLRFPDDLHLLEEMILPGLRPA
ncbi:MAG: TetR/AcrR family transcriptional regulator [Leptospiraceae bacterium]|nr:TetR/AcrR family transcriptional regulator [Leptospiraceae bacterium]